MSSQPKTHAEHLADYVLERLAHGLAENEGLTGEALRAAQQADMAFALQRLLGAVGDSYETRLIVLLGLRDDDGYRCGPATRSIVEARVCAQRDTRALMPAKFAKAAA
jgi:hypothetical protein